MTDSKGPPAPLFILSEARERLLTRIAFEAVWESSLQDSDLLWYGNLESIFGYKRDEVVNHASWWRERIHPDDIERVQRLASAALKGDAPGWSSEYRFRRKDGSWAWVASRCAIERDAEGRACHAIGAMIDITRLKDTESRLRLFTEQIPARACATDRDLRVVWDLGAAFPNDPPVVGKTVPELFETSPDRERVLDGCRRALAGESSKLEIDDGTSAAQLQLEPLRDPGRNVIGVVGIAFDITERKRAAEELGRRAQQLEALSRKLIEAQEVERRAVALELHDDFGQTLAALKLNLKRLQHDDSDSIALVDDAIVRMRDLAQTLRPPLLEELGLAAALRWYVQREAKRAELPFRLATPLEERLPVAVETTCFRVAQEALTNVIRHSRAHLVEIELGKADGELLLVVRDDGHGFDVAVARNHAIQGRSQGLLSMQERVALAGGDLQIDSTPGGGTCVRARLPIGDESNA